MRALSSVLFGLLLLATPVWADEGLPQGCLPGAVGEVKTGTQKKVLDPPESSEHGFETAELIHLARIRLIPRAGQSALLVKVEIRNTDSGPVATLTQGPIDDQEAQTEQTQVLPSELSAALETTLTKNFPLYESFSLKESSSLLDRALICISAWPVVKLSKLAKGGIAAYKGGLPYTVLVGGKTIFSVKGFSGETWSNLPPEDSLPGKDLLPKDPEEADRTAVDDQHKLAVNRFFDRVEALFKTEEIDALEKKLLANRDELFPSPSAIGRWLDRVISTEERGYLSGLVTLELNMRKQADNLEADAPGGPMEILQAKMHADDRLPWLNHQLWQQYGTAYKIFEREVAARSNLAKPKQHIINGFTLPGF